MLALGAGGGLLALLAAGAGAGRVTAVERSRSLYRMTRQALEANAARGEVARAVQLVDRKLQAVGVQGVCAVVRSRGKVCMWCAMQWGCQVSVRCDAVL